MYIRDGSNKMFTMIIFDAEIENLFSKIEKYLFEQGVKNKTGHFFFLYLNQSRFYLIFRLIFCDEESKCIYHCFIDANILIKCSFFPNSIHEIIVNLELIIHLLSVFVSIE